MNNAIEQTEGCDPRKVRHDLSAVIAALQTALSGTEVSEQLVRLSLEKLRSTMDYIDRTT